MRKAKKGFTEDMLSSVKPSFDYIPCRLKFKPPMVHIDQCINDCIYKCSLFKDLNYFVFYCENEGCFEEDMCLACRKKKEKARIYIHMRHTLMSMERRERIYEKAVGS